MLNFTDLALLSFTDNKKMGNRPLLYQQIYCFKNYLFPVRPLPDRAKLHDDVNLFGNARITSDRSKIPTVASKHSKPIT